MTQANCHGSGFSGCARQRRPLVCRNARIARRALRTRSTSNQAPGCWSAWNASTAGAAASASAIWSSVRPSSSRASRGTGSAGAIASVEDRVVIVVTGRCGQPRRRRQAELPDVAGQLRPVLAEDRGPAVLLPAALAQLQHPVPGQRPLSLVDPGTADAVVQDGDLVNVGQAAHPDQDRDDPPPLAP